MNTAQIVMRNAGETGGYVYEVFINGKEVRRVLGMGVVVKGEDKQVAMYLEFHGEKGDSESDIRKYIAGQGVSAVIARELFEPPLWKVEVPLMYWPSMVLPSVPIAHDSKRT